MHIIKKYLNVEASNFEEMINQVGTMLYQAQIVQYSFMESILQREINFPTGLTLPNVNVAIPHTDPIHVKQSGIVFVRTSHTIKMIKMATRHEYINVRLFFLLLVQDGKLQVDVLSKLIAHLHDKHFIKLIQSADEGIKQIKITI